MTASKLGERDTDPSILDYADDIQTPEEWKGEVRGGRAVRSAAPIPIPPTPSQQEALSWVDGLVSWASIHGDFHAYESGLKAFILARPDAPISPTPSQQEALDAANRLLNFAPEFEGGDEFSILESFILARPGGEKK